MGSRCILLALRRDACKGHAVAMATDAIVDNTDVVHRRPCEIGELACRMAGLACPAGRNVVRRLGHRRYSCIHLPVMAACAVAENAGVNHRRTGEISELARRMTGLASSAGRQMVRRLGYWGHAGKHLAVMAACAVTEDAGVDHRSTSEISEFARQVAGLACLAGRQVVARFRYRRYTNKHLAVMAARATAEDATVVHHA